MNPCSSALDIVPGEAVGPFRLYMERSQVHALARELGISVQSDWSPVDSNCEGLRSRGIEFCDILQAGLSFYYNAAGQCIMIEALVGWPHHPQPRPTFRLFGVAINHADDKVVLKLCRDRWTDVSEDYCGMRVPSAGLEALYWDRSDGSYHVVSVVPPCPEVTPPCSG